MVEDHSKGIGFERELSQDLSLDSLFHVADLQGIQDSIAMAMGVASCNLCSMAYTDTRKVFAMGLLPSLEKAEALRRRCCGKYLQSFCQKLEKFLLSYLPPNDRTDAVACRA